MQLSRSALATRPNVSRPSSVAALPRVAKPANLRITRVRATEPETEFMTEAERKKAEADKLRAAEKFMVVGGSSAKCKGCGYEYKQEKGDPDFPVPPGVSFQALPADYICPVCGGAKNQFEANMKVVAGFAENQQYGLGGNSLTEGQKSGLIYGALAFGFFFFLSGYFLQ